MYSRLILTLLSSLFLMGQASAGLISVSAEVAGGNDYGGVFPVGTGSLSWASGQAYSPALVFWSQNLVSVPPTPIQLSVQVWDGAYGTSPFKQLTVNATISGQVLPNTFDWQFSAMPLQVTFGDTTATVSFQAVPIPTPDHLPYGASPPSGPTYYTAFDVEANVTPEPSSAVLLAGLTLGGLVARRFRRA